MSSPTEHHPPEPGFANLPTEQVGEAPTAFIAAVRARRRTVRTRRVSAAMLVAAVAVVGWRLVPTPTTTDPAPSPTPSIASGTPDWPALSAPGGSGVTLASLRRLCAQAEGPGLPDFPAAKVAAATEAPLRLRDIDRVLAGGV